MRSSIKGYHIPDTTPYLIYPFGVQDSGVTTAAEQNREVAGLTEQLAALQADYESLQRAQQQLGADRQVPSATAATLSRSPSPKRCAQPSP